MNNKGLTLIEVIGTLILLSVVALIVTPNIYQTIKEYQQQLFDTQMNNIKEAGKNWSADNIDKVPTSNSYALKISVKELQNEGYIDDKLKNPRDGNYFDDSEIFVLISCDYIQDETNNISSNYKYTYGVYENIEDYLKKMAMKYAKDNSNISATVTTNNLKQKKYVANIIKDLSGNTIQIPSKTLEVTATESNEKVGEYIYSVTIK